MIKSISKLFFNLLRHGIQSCKGSRTLINLWNRMGFTQQGVHRAYAKISIRGYSMSSLYRASLSTDFADSRFLIHPKSYFYTPHIINISQNGSFEIVRNHTRRLVMSTKFWSFVYVIVKGSWAKVGSDIFTNLEMMCLQSWSIDFFLFLCSEVEKKNQCFNFEDLSF